jgi:hypothetical protein
MRNTVVYEAAYVVTPQQADDAIALAELVIAEVVKLIS